MCPLTLRLSGINFGRCERLLATLTLNQPAQNTEVDFSE